MSSFMGGVHVFIFWAILLIFCMKATSVWYFFFLEKKFEIFFLGHLFWPFEIFPFYTSWSHALVFWKIFLIFSIKARSVWYFIFLEKKMWKFFWDTFFCQFEISHFKLLGLTSSFFEQFSWFFAWRPQVCDIF